MKKHLLFCAVLLGCGLFCPAQIFQKTYGSALSDGGNAVQQTKDGGYILTGNKGENGTLGEDAFLIKTNSAGDTVWTKTYGGNNTEKGYAVQQTIDGGYIMAGATTSFGFNAWDMYVVKTDVDGFPLWSKTFGGAQDDKAFAVKQTADTGYIIVGSTTSLGQGAEDVYVVKLNVFGNLIWSKSLGGTGRDEAYGVQQTKDKGYIIAGITGSFGVSRDFFLIKLDSAGNVKWTKTIGGTGDDGAYSILNASDGGYIMAGYSTSFSTDFDMLVVKTDSAGTAQWSKTYGSTGNDIAYNITAAGSGYAVAGFYTNANANADAYVIRITATGDTLWTRTFGGPGDDKCSSVNLTSDGGFVISGHTELSGTGNLDAYVVKCDSNGNGSCNQFTPATRVTARNVQTFPVIATLSSGGLTVTAQTVIKSGATVLNTCTTGMDEISQNKGKLTLYPNPADGNFNIELNAENESAARLVIVNMLGETVLDKAISLRAQHNIISLASTEFRGNLAAGDYSIRIISNHAVFTGRVSILK